MATFEAIEEVEAEEAQTISGLDQYVTDYKTELDNAKTFLQKCSPFTGDNLYDHLSSVLDKILAERPENVVDFFEEYSRQVKEKRFRALTLHLKNMFVPPLRYEYTFKLMPMLKVIKKTTPHPLLFPFKTKPSRRSQRKNPNRAPWTPKTKTQPTRVDEIFCSSFKTSKKSASAFPKPKCSACKSPCAT